MGIDFSSPKLPQILESSLALVSRTYSLRCDAKQAQDRFLEFDKYINKIKYFELSEYLPNPIIKGIQPTYLEELDAIGIPVINTLAIQNLRINIESCRFITESDYAHLDSDRKCKKDDVLLTVDGGTSIGKAVLFNLPGQFTIDSHVTILRPVGLSPNALVYLLASPIGQLQFQRAESGASGQTSVTEDDIRRFKFPLIEKKTFENAVKLLDKRRLQIESEIASLSKKLDDEWISFSNKLFK